MPAPPAPPALPSTFSKKQAEKAVDALLKHHTSTRAKREETELIVKDEHVWLVVNTKREGKVKKLLPTTIRLPNPPLPPPPATSVCLLTKDPQRKYKDLIEEQKIKFINRVVGVEKLKGKFKPYEARRQLMKEHEVFLCDDAIVGILPKLLGKVFFDAKKQPIPVNLKRKDLKAELSRAISSTYFHPSAGTSNAVRISTPTSHTSAQTLANILAALPQVVAKLDGEWDNVLNIGIKTNSSVMLPIWASTMSGRFEKPEVDEEQIKAKKGKKGKKVAEESDSDVAMDVPATTTATKKGKGKRPAEDAEDVEVAKASTGKKAKTAPAPAAPTPALAAKSAPTPSKKKAAQAAPERKKTAGGAGAGKKLKAGVLGKAK